MCWPARPARSYGQRRSRPPRTRSGLNGGARGAAKSVWPTKPSRRERLEQRLAAASGQLDERRARAARTERELATFARSSTSLEAQLGTLLQADDSGSPDRLDLRGLTVLYVGGRANQAPQMKGLVEQHERPFPAS